MARKSNGEPKIFAYEEFMAKARKEGRVRNEELSMKVLKPDLSLQARVNHINVDHVRALHDILKGGQQLAPIIVFEIEELKGKVVVKTFKIADGFHRHEVYKREGRPGIPCVVVTGTLQEAIEYAASANQTLSLRRSQEDKKKAVFMLLANGWLNRTHCDLEKQSGVTRGTITKCIAEYCVGNNIEVPRTRINSDGRPTSSHAPFRVTRKPQGDSKTGEIFSVRSRGENLYGGNTLEQASQVAADAKREFESRRSILEAGKLQLALARRGVVAEKALGTTLYSIRGFKAGRYTATVCLDDYGDRPTYLNGLASAIGRVLILAEHFHLSLKAVIIPEPVKGVECLRSIASRLGVEFMTLDEFVAAVKAEQPASVPATATALA